MPKLAYTKFNQSIQPHICTSTLNIITVLLQTNYTEKFNFYTFIILPKPVNNSLLGFIIPIHIVTAEKRARKIP